MNRLSLPEVLELPATDCSLEWHCAVDAGATERPREREIDCSVFAPMHYEPGYAYPLLIWLHADGGNDQQLRRVMPHVSVRNYVAVAARGLPTIDAQRDEFCWPETADGAEHAADQVRQSLEFAQNRYNVHPDRVFIAGHQGGGTMALRLALCYPGWFAGAISLCGPMPRGGAPLKHVNAARRLPLLLAATQKSRIYSASRITDDLRLLHSAGFSLALRHYPGEDDLTTTMLGDVDRWVMDLVCSTPVGSES